MISWNQIGDYNPQLMREIKGRLTPIQFWGCCGSAIFIQVTLLTMVWTTDPGGVSEILFYLLTWILPLTWIMGSAYSLQSDINREIKTGTLNFIQLSPRSNASILISGSGVGHKPIWECPWWSSVGLSIAFLWPYLSMLLLSLIGSKLEGWGQEMAKVLILIVSCFGYGVPSYGLLPMPWGLLGLILPWGLLGILLRALLNRTHSLGRSASARQVTSAPMFEEIH